MEVMAARCCGLDVHKQTVVACLLVPGPAGEAVKETRTFGTLAADLLALGDWLEAAGCTHVAIESTGVYWQPVWNLLEDRFVVILANARHVKAVPGRKTDVRDAEWLAELLRHGLIQPSFVPDRPARELRELTRYRRSLIGQRTAEVNRLQKVLEAANLKLTAVASKVLGASAREILEQLLAGERDPAALADLARGRLRAKIPDLERALAGRFDRHQQLLVGELLAHIDYLDASLARLTEEIGERLRPFDAAIERLDGIPGVGRRVAEDLLAEIGTDMARFPTAGHLASWAKLCPGSDASAGVRRSGKTGRGNKWLRAILVEAGHAAGRKRGTFLQGVYGRLAGRRGKKRAAVAVGHRILVLAYYMLRDGSPYREPGPTPQRRRQQDHTARAMIRQLERLGYHVTRPDTLAS